MTLIQTLGLRELVVAVGIDQGDSFADEKVR